MRLPNSSLVQIDREKLADYLLNASHPDNGGKAGFFECHGFTSNNWPQLMEALRKLADSNDVTRFSESAHGKKYVVDGRIETPRGKQPLVRTVWIVDRGMDTPRLVTAYPAEEPEAP